TKPDLLSRYVTAHTRFLIRKLEKEVGVRSKQRCQLHDGQGRKENNLSVDPDKKDPAEGIEVARQKAELIARSEQRLLPSQLTKTQAQLVTK
ncbi:unnamed protein product, partial [Chrysoparadoxa australica]